MSLDIAFYRLHNQCLLGRKLDTPADVVHWLGAVQAQDYAGAKWAIGQRMKDAADAALEQAMTDGSILRTHLLRPTWHFVTPIDIRWMLELTAPRIRALLAYMDRQLELDRAICRKSNAVLTKSLRGGNQLTRAELEIAFQKARIPATGQRTGHLLMHAELDGVVCSGPRRGKQFTYALLEERVPPAKALTRDQALAELVKKYFVTRGPATLKDFCVWSGLTMEDARNGIEMVRSSLDNEERDGRTYWFKETSLPPKERSPIAHLLPNYDEYFIGFKDRGAIGQVAGRAGIQKDDPTLIAHVILLDGQIVGSWKRTLKKNEVVVQLSPFTTLTKAETKAVQAASARYGRFLGAAITLKEH